MYLYRFDRNTVWHASCIHVKYMDSRPSVRDAAQHDSQQGLETKSQKDLHLYGCAENTESP